MLPGDLYLRQLKPAVFQFQLRACAILDEVQVDVDCEREPEVCIPGCSVSPEADPVPSFLWSGPPSLLTLGNRRSFVSWRASSVVVAVCPLLSDCCAF